MTPSESASSPPPTTRWQAPLDPNRYDREPSLRPNERAALAELHDRQARGPERSGAWPKAIHAALHRLVAPLEDALRVAAYHAWRERHATVHLLVDQMHRRQTAYWAWTRDEWVAVLQTADNDLRHYGMAVAYLLVDYRDLHCAFPGSKRCRLAWKLFGQSAVEASVERVGAELRRWGYGRKLGLRFAPGALCELLLERGSPYLEDLDAEVVTVVYNRMTSLAPRRALYRVTQALVTLGVLKASPLAEQVSEEAWLAGTTAARADVPAVWAEWCQRWFRTATGPRKSRTVTYYYLLKVGRWLAHAHPEVTSPEQWTRDLTAEYVAAVTRMTLGEWTHAPTTERLRVRVGQPLMARTKNAQLGALRLFFRDCQAWGWLPTHFDPFRALATPRSVRALIGPDPRVIADDVWAKLLWAGLNLTVDDLPKHGRSDGKPWYPLALVRAVVVVWLFAGLRVDELVRLRLGCVRWQRPDGTASGTGRSGEPASIPQDAVCLLDVPAHKTGRPFTKPVDRVVGEAILTWEQVRSVQPLLVDPKTGEAVAFLFTYRGQRLSRHYVNRVLIPLLCRKANVPTADACGNLTSHRARATIATQLFNAKEPMTLFELQEWLGHRWPVATQHYAKITPTKLTQAYADAGYFGRNLRTIEVLIDQDMVKSGAAATGEPWRFYDLGHGYCTYDFFDQCPHRMACAKCAFYRPKGSSQAQFLEAKANLLRLKQDIPLTEEERAAVEDGLAALERLCKRLAEVPTPAGPTPRELGTASVIPLSEIQTTAKREAP